MISSSQIVRQFTLLYSVAFVALALGPLATDAFARGRSFSVEVTGTIVNVDWRNFEFTLRVDEPARRLVIGVGRDCKFLKHGAQAKIDILKKGAHVKVGYFATIFTGNVAVKIEANPKTKSVHGVIERIEPANRRLALRLNRSCRSVLRWAANAHLVNRRKVIAPTSLKDGMVVDVSYYSFAFESKYAVSVEAQPPFLINPIFM